MATRFEGSNKINDLDSEKFSIKKWDNDMDVMTKTQKTDYQVLNKQIMLDTIMSEALKRPNYPVPIENKNVIKIKETVDVDSNDKEEVTLIQETYQNSLHHYERVQQQIVNISDKEFLNVVEELQLITRNILVKFNEKPFRIIQNSHFVDYYQDRFAQFVERIVELETNAVNPNKDSIKQLKELVANLKIVFKSTYNTLSETDMNDLTAEIKTMKQSLSEYTQNIDKTVPEAILKDNISFNHIDSKIWQIKNKSPEENKQAQLKEQTMDFSIGIGLGIVFVTLIIDIIISFYVFS